MPRAKLGEAKLTGQVGFRLTDDQMREVEKRARRAGRAVSDYARRIVIAHIRKENRDEAKHTGTAQ